MKLQGLPARGNTQPTLPFPDGSLLQERASPRVRRQMTAHFPVVDMPAAEYITEPARLAAVLPEILGAPVVGMDTETSGLDPHTARIRLVQLATPGRVVVVDANTCDVRALSPLFDGGRRVFLHNAKFDLKFLATAGVRIPDGCSLFDTLLAAQLLGAGTEEGRPRGLGALVARYLGLSLDKSLQESDWTGALTAAQLAYAARDAAVLLPLAEKLVAEIATAGLGQVAEIEMRACPALAWLEAAGMPLDTERWQERAVAELRRARDLEQQLAATAGATVNWQSVRQVRAVFQARGHALANTQEATLLTLSGRDALAAMLLQYRAAARRASAYGGDWITTYVHPVMGRVHADFLQIGAPSGRMACLRPNLQNIPRSAAYRRCIRPADGQVLVKADFSQIELRIVAVVAPDAAMLHAYRQGEDLHVKTAAAVLGIPTAEVTKEQRQLAKALNFGLIYGMGAQGLKVYAATRYGVPRLLVCRSRVLPLTDEAASRHRRRFFVTYRGLWLWHRRVADRLQHAGAIETRTLTGRRQLHITSFPIALNTPVQGTGADGLKLALARLYEHRQEVPAARLIATVHDEILAECPAEQAAATAAWLRRHMVAAMAEVVTAQVPIIVDTTIGLDWAGTANPLGSGNDGRGDDPEAERMKAEERRAVQDESRTIER
jgi:DNA polymerase I-like protein with 3'-5' exonuclease and polymerase domains